MTGSRPLLPASPSTTPGATIAGPSRSVRRGLPGFLVLATLVLGGCATFAEYDSELDFGLGVRGELPMDRVLTPTGTAGGATVHRLEMAGSLHRFTPGDATVLMGSGDVILPLVRMADGAARLYTGAGVHLGRRSVDVPVQDGGGTASSVSGGATLLGGVRFEHQGVAPFFEVRGGIGGYSSLSAMAGIRFLSRAPRDR
jgi:hypothetical protein